MQGCSPSLPAGPRLWRCAAQRSLRNAWCLISSHLSAWSSSSSDGLSAASSVVNALLSYRYVESLDFGVLKAMDGIQANARKKYLHRGEASFVGLLKSFKELVENLSAMLNAKGRMRAYLKGPSSGNLVEFSDQRHFIEDAGDGDGLAVFSVLSVSTHEMLAQELVDLFVAEIKVKWLIVSELHSVFYSGADVDCAKVEASTKLMQNVYVETSSKLPEVFNKENQHISLPSQQGSQAQVKREVLQVYLTAWLAEVNVRKSRIDQILRVVSEEMQCSLQ